jgi:hypothetical protein
VSKAKVKVEAKPWQRITTATGEPHDHGVHSVLQQLIKAFSDQVQSCAGLMLTYHFAQASC